MMQAIRNFFTAPVFKEDEEKTRAANMLYRILIATYVLLPPAILISIFDPDIARFYSSNAYTLATLATILLVIAKMGHIRAASITLITSILVLSTIVDLFVKGTMHPMSILLGAAIIMSGLLLGSRSLYIVAIISGVKHILVLYLIHNHLISINRTIPDITPTINALSTFAAYFLIALLFSLASNSLQAAVTRARQSEAGLFISNRELKEITQNLEKRIKERTQDLENTNTINEKRARQFEAITRISSAIASVQNLQELLPRISEVISQQFGFYHAGIFLTDASKQYAILSAANSEGGRKMIRRNHQLKIGEQGIVGYVTQTGKPRIALDVGEDANYFTNPELPSTHSEMALPLKAGNETIGALDIQSTEVGAFTDEDFKTLSALADQVSLAIQNARLFGQTQKALSESETIQRQYVRQTWERLSTEEKVNGYHYSIAGVTELNDEEKKNVNENKIDGQNIDVPIILRGEIIGTLSVQAPKNEQVGADQMDLIKAVAERVALSAENARLFDETKRRAEREHIVSDITTKIRSTNDPQEMIKTAIEELKRAIGVSRVEIVPKKKQPDSR